MTGNIIAVFHTPNEYKKFRGLIDLSKHLHIIREEDLDSALKKMKSLNEKSIVVINSKDLEQYLEMLRQGFKNEVFRLSKYKEKYRDLLEISSEYPDFIGRSEAIRNICRQIGIVSKSNSNVLIQGESGTGKEVVARSIHNYSSRKNAPFVSINCAAIPEGLLESELFGSVKGAYTGAIRDYQGRLKQAHGGTFLFDEICSMSPSGQAKLLRVLQEREYQPVGGNETIKFNARVISTSNVNLLEKVNENKFREDLYYRLNVFPIYIPPLRERREDIPVLARHFLKKYRTTLKKNIVDFTPGTIAILLDHEWPGNVRELENCIEYAVIVENKEYIEPSSLPLRFNGKSRKIDTSDFKERSLRKKIMIFEREVILKALEEANWVKKKAAHLLGIDPKNLNYYLIKNHIIKPEINHKNYGDKTK